MFDAIFVAGTIVFFVLSVLFVRGCEAM